MSPCFVIGPAWILRISSLACSLGRGISERIKISQVKCLWWWKKIKQSKLLWCLFGCSHDTFVEQQHTHFVKVSIISFTVSENIKMSFNHYNLWILVRFSVLYILVGSLRKTTNSEEKSRICVIAWDRDSNILDYEYSDLEVKCCK